MKFSIITVALNAEDVIAETVMSILNQTCTDYEIIIKDGCSSDKTLERIPQSDKITVIQKPDKGVYQAMNQAVECAKGDYLLFLNCGDTLYSADVLEKTATAIVEKKADILYGDVFLSEHGTLGSGVVASPEKVTKTWLFNNMINHQTIFFSRRVFEKVGMYDETLKITSDWVLLLDSKIKKLSFAHFDCVVSEYLGGGLSETEEARLIVKHERNKIAMDRYGIIAYCVLRLAFCKYAKLLHDFCEKLFG